MKQAGLAVLAAWVMTVAAYAGDCNAKGNDAAVKDDKAKTEAVAPSEMTVDQLKQLIDEKQKVMRKTCCPKAQEQLKQEIKELKKLLKDKKSGK